MRQLNGTHSEMHSLLAIPVCSIGSVQVSTVKAKGVRMISC